MPGSRNSGSRFHPVWDNINARFSDLISFLNDVRISQNVRPYFEARFVAVIILKALYFEIVPVDPHSTSYHYEYRKKYWAEYYNENYHCRIKNEMIIYCDLLRSSIAAYYKLYEISNYDNVVYDLIVNNLIEVLQIGGVDQRTQEKYLHGMRRIRREAFQCSLRKKSS